MSNFHYQSNYKEILAELKQKTTNYKNNLTNISSKPQIL
jgi:hypothetical protein